MSLCEKCGVEELDQQTGLCPVCDVVKLSRAKADMKRKKTFLITLCVFLVFIVLAIVISFSVKGVIDNARADAEASSIAHEEEINGYYQNLIGTYKGSYSPGQGECGLTLTVYEEEGAYYATFDFYNLPDTWVTQEGSYTMNVAYNEETGEFNFVGYEWINQPDDYVMVDLTGSLDGDVLSGRSPTEFSVTRVYEE